MVKDEGQLFQTRNYCYSEMGIPVFLEQFRRKQTAHLSFGKNNLCCIWYSIAGETKSLGGQKVVVLTPALISISRGISYSVVAFAVSLKYTRSH